MTPREYKTSAAFKSALEQRLRDSASSGVDFDRRRQLLVFDRFLARVSMVYGDAVMLKGGLVLELRLERARTTKDVDLRVTGPSAEVLSRLQEACRIDSGDFMTFEIQPDAVHPDIQNDGMKYDGMRFRAECKLGAKVYGRPFGVDVAFGDPIIGEPDLRSAEDVLAFVGVPPPILNLYPVETHIAEKLHAYTMPRKRPNSRVKDLPDIALLATTGEIDAARLRAALEQTFDFRKTHPLPSTLPSPPSGWLNAYGVMAEENELRWRSLAEVHEAASAFMNPILAGRLEAAWRPAEWVWSLRSN